jgi:hypothetical protein
MNDRMRARLIAAPHPPPRSPALPEKLCYIERRVGTVVTRIEIRKEPWVQVFGEDIEILLEEVMELYKTEKDALR